MEQCKEDDNDEYRGAFNLFDKDGKGTITVQEFKQAMVSLGQDPDEEELREMMKQVDLDGNNEIDFEEFVAMMRNFEPEDEEKQWKQAFDFFDKDRSGFIEKVELKELMASLGDNLTDEQLEEMMHEADLNGDKKIDYSEFLAMMQK